MDRHAGLVSEAETLVARIRRAPAQRRLELQPSLGEVIERLTSTGQTVPRKLRLLHDELLDEAIEARFDNIPV